MMTISSGVIFYLQRVPLQEESRGGKGRSGCPVQARGRLGTPPSRWSAVI